MEENKELIGNLDSPLHLTDGNFADALNKYKMIVVDFWAPWCMPCKMIEPAVENLAKKYQGKVVFGKMNVDENPNTPAMFSIMSIPTLIVFKNGKMVDTLIGAMPEGILENRILKSVKE